MKQHKILIFGAGVIGSIYAGKLALSGQNITILARVIPAFPGAGGKIEGWISY